MADSVTPKVNFCTNSNYKRVKTTHIRPARASVAVNSAAGPSAKGFPVPTHEAVNKQTPMPIAYLAVKMRSVKQITALGRICQSETKNFRLLVGRYQIKYRRILIKYSLCGKLIPTLCYKYKKIQYYATQNRNTAINNTSLQPVTKFPFFPMRPRYHR